MAHEVGHTLGLRHNFQGSYDSLNYFDGVLEAAQSSLKPYQRCEADGPRDFSSCDLYEVSEMTPKPRLEGQA
jgi:hypothetical protein